MPTEYTVKNNETGQEITFDWNGAEPPTDADMEEVFAAAAPKAEPVSRETKKPGYGQRVQSAIEEQAQRTTKDISAGRNPILPTIRGVTGSMAAYVNEAPGIKQITELIGKGAGKAIGAIPGAQGAVEKGAAGYQKLPASIRDIVEISGNVGTFVPAAGVAVKAGKAIPGAAAAAGRQVEKVGIESLGGQLKIKQGLAQRGYGNRIDQKKQNILNNISKYNLESMTGNFSKMSDSASKMATERINKADEILQGIAASPDAPRGQFVDDIIMDAMDKIDDTAAIGKEAQAQKVLDDILSGATGRGLAGTGDQGIDAIITFKRNLDPDGNLFKSGPGVSDADNLDRAIRKQLYRSAVDKIREISPEAADLNKQAKELIDIANVAGDAASRTANPNKVFSMSNMLLGGFGGAGAAALQSPEVAAGTVGALLAKAAGNQGRGPALLMKTGKAMQGKIPIGRKGIPEILKNERGFVGGTRTPFQQAVNKVGAPTNLMKQRKIQKNATSDRSDPFYSTTLSKEEWTARKKEMDAIERLAAAQGEEPFDYNPSELLTEQEFGMRAAENMRDVPGIEGEQLKNQLKNQLGFSGRKEIRIENLSPKKQMEINKLAHRIIEDSDTRNRFIESGLIRSEQTDVHPDDIVRWINQAQGESAIKKLLGK